MDFSDPSSVTSPHVLDYGRERGRLGRFRRIAVVLLILASIAGGLWFAVPRVLHAVRLKSAVAECNAWAEKARTHLLRDGTLLYSESISDQYRLGNPIGTVRFTLNSGTSQPTQYVTGSGVARQYPLLREIAYRQVGIPILSDFRNFVYVHEHPMWLAPAGLPPPVFSVYYIGPSPAGDPQFGVTARMFPLDPQGRSNMVGGIATSPPPGRPLHNLRLYAGQPNPSDPTRFHVPFSCDAGTGRFEFQTDTDASDGGLVVPTLTIAWDAPPTTRPR